MHPGAAEAQTRALRAMTAEQKPAVAQQLRQTARELTAAGPRLRHAECPDDAIRARVREIFLRAVT
jgi:hypothetical protein